MAYPCVMLNYQVHKLHTNYQWALTLLSTAGTRLRSTPSATSSTRAARTPSFFELDGPYRAMVLPASTEEGRLLKKRSVYALKLTPATPCSTWMAPWLS